jgi:competence protein ComEA
MRYLEDMKRAIAFALAMCLTPPAGAQDKFPDVEGKAVTVRMCTRCHDAAGITSARNTKDRWETIVMEMVSRGAEGSDDEIDQVIAYLSKNFGPKKIAVNQAVAKEIAAALDLSSVDADAIVQYREKNGAFKEWRDLSKVAGVDMKKVEKNKDRLEF